MINFLFKKKSILASILFLMFTIVLFTAMTSFEDEKEFRVREFKVFESKGDFSALDTTLYELVESEKIKLGFVSGEVWLEFNTREFSGTGEEFKLEIENPSFRKIDLYRVTKEGQVILSSKAGLIEGSNNPFHYPNPVFNIFDDENYSDRYILNIDSKEPLNFSIGVFNNDNFFNKYSKTMLLVSIYTGIMLALFLYNLILYFSVKDNVYIFYCFYILFFALAQMSLLGFSFYFILGESIILYEISIIAFSAFSGIMGVIFVKVFLQTKLYVPLLDKVLSCIAFIYILAFVSRLFSLAAFSYVLTDIAGLLVPVTFISAGVITLRKGHRSAAYFLIAWFVLLLGLIIYIFQSHELIELDTFANLPMLVGSALEAILLSLALADRINILKKEKEQEQNEKVAALSENERLIKEQNAYLEKMVLSRTEELELALKNLQNTQIQLVNQEKMASLGQLTAGIAHEINNPINFVSSNISPLKRDLADIMEMVTMYREKGEEEFSAESKKELKNFEEDIELDYLIEEVGQLLQGIEDGAKRTVEIVRGLRLFSRVDEQDVKEVNLHDGLDSTLILLSSSMQGKITVTKEYGEIPMVECLAGKINQVFMNVINNAVHALLDPNQPIENPEITIRTKQQGGEVWIEIQDNGVGMPDHVKEKVFEPFFTTKEVGKGTGLGLSIVYTVIENHQGKLEIHSKLNKGTNFVIMLPVNQKTNKSNEG